MATIVFESNSSLRRADPLPFICETRNPKLETDQLPPSQHAIKPIIASESRRRL